MAARAIWRGAISFGMVTIPVSLYPATQTKDISFHLLHKEDHARLRFVRWCPVDEREVPNDEIVRGYEFAKGQYVVLDDQDFEKLPLPSKHTIEISAFVEASEIAPVYFERAYYLEPQEIGVKPYRLFLEALERKQLVALGKVALRHREHLCALRPSGGAVELETLYYADEIRERPKVAEASVSEGELDMASSLIDLLRKNFEPDTYHDEYRTALLELIEAKQQGRKVVVEAAPAEGKVTDLMEALRKSVEAARKTETKARPRRKAS
ncbi:MAG TPA: Ku protein [Chloroflexota bacterium]|nr:Ku protein [Chloroflexota bacterium]